ncbi:hypothetical protein SSBR45G_56610 [Bradyrhizobium sp. SSBR45G]|uniref:hypothetical protein n=1 Tax=unclassified Bradyrhizobium TaxID=2631580 RepID=UPI0023429026|nr:MULTISPECIES: hypothetical protein [unclassified Bradyrhizobium]GLH80752.1 hypothetical protein SSBR45G_56610 [Bradyrhizobium sp. SSBR45G]GLH88210.1 hypothetical protein SSBR45R_56710 [Bradyrhizobium sp. SSBR45R]
MRRIVSFLSLLVLIPASLVARPAHADDGFKGIDTLHGTCKKLAVAGKERTSDCRGVLLNTRYADQRTGFYFVTTDGAMITFSSPGELSQRESKVAGAYPVDMMILKIEGDVRRVAAKGMCHTSKLTIATAKLNCLADSELGRFEGEFVPGTKPPGS